MSNIMTRIMTRRRQARIARYATLLALLAAPAFADSLLERVEHPYAENDGVRIHFAALGEGPLIVMIHGLGGSRAAGAGPQ